MSVGLEREAGAHGQCAMGEALFCFEIANEFAASAFRQFGLRKLDVGGLEVGIDVCCGGLFTDYEDLGVGDREGQDQEACE
jgi:hypothetical protein